MEYPGYFYLGYIKKVIGTKGEVLFQLETDQPENYQKLTIVFIEIKGNLIPYQIKKLSVKGNKAQVKLQDINTTEKAEFLVGSELHLPLKMLPKLKGNNFYYHEVIGFNVEDKKFGEIGTIKKISDHGPQAIFHIDHKNTEVLIPIADEFITKVDRSKKTIFVQTPEGLIELYLEP